MIFTSPVLPMYTMTLNVRNIAKLKDPFMEKYMNGKNNYKLKSL